MKNICFQISAISQFDITNYKFNIPIITFTYLETHFSFILDYIFYNKKFINSIIFKSMENIPFQTLTYVLEKL